jgi:hypothetical protein
MTTAREPRLEPVAILDLRPTQITVGMHEVKAKLKHWRAKLEQVTAARGARKAETFLGTHMIPVILGPSGRYYVIDHHHLARALHEDGIKDVAITVVANLSKLDRNSFWFFMECHGWTHPYDANGRRRPYTDLPKSVDKLINDPFRSLAGELRRAGGFAKDTTPFSEFLWAQFLRQCMKRKAVEANFDRAIEKALQLAKSVDADHLPGWCGPVVQHE